MLIEREWLLIAWATVVSVWILWADIRPMLPDWPRIKLSRSDQKEVARKAMMLADSAEELRSHLGPDGWPNTDQGQYLATRTLMDIMAFSNFLNAKGINLPGLPSSRTDSMKVAPFLSHVQKTYLVVGTMLGTASAKELDAALRARQKEICKEYNVDEVTGEPLPPLSPLDIATETPR